MTINEKKQLVKYIKGLVRESINEMPLPSGFFQGAENLPDNGDEKYEEENDGIADEMRQDDEWGDDGNIYDDEIAGLDELRQLTESMARQALTEILSESKKKKGKRKNKKKKGKRKNKKEKTSSKDKTVVSKLNADGTNAAHYFYKLYGVENGTDAEKAAARSKGYKKAKGKKNDTGVPYKFTSKERNRLNSLLTDR